MPGPPPGQLMPPNPTEEELNASPNDPSKDASRPTSSQSESQDPKKPILGLPDPSASQSEDNSIGKIDMSSGGGTAKLDNLGPMVVNTDGTLSRITNWEQMTEMERAATMRIIGKRNKERLERLRGGEGKA